VGIVLQEKKRDMVYGRIARRVRALGLSGVGDYCKLLAGENGGDEMGDLVNAITTNLTSFFREAHHFEHLAKNVFVPFAKSRESRLRVWSAGCSAGAEAYTIAMMLCENVPDYARRDCKILATDIDTNVLNTGRNGQYDEDWLEKIPANLRAKYVEQNPITCHPRAGGDLKFLEKKDSRAGGNDNIIKNQMNAKLRDLVTFNQLNLLDNWPFKGKFDVIFCRNVLIYFDKPTQVKLFARYADALKPNGYIYIGHSETMHNLCDRFKLIDKTTYQRVK